jgi:hypothetical protein
LAPLIQREQHRKRRSRRGIQKKYLHDDLVNIIRDQRGRKVGELIDVMVHPFDPDSLFDRQKSILGKRS